MSQIKMSPPCCEESSPPPGTAPPPVCSPTVLAGFGPRLHRQQPLAKCLHRAAILQLTVPGSLRVQQGPARPHSPLPAVGSLAGGPDAAQPRGARRKDAEAGFKQPSWLLIPRALREGDAGSAAHESFT